MVQSETTAVRHWAVLIGVNFYPRDNGGILSKDECLRGAVPDVLAMKQYLETAPYPVDITLLTATAPTDPASTTPREDRSLWPTRDNVGEKLKRVQHEARRGDFIYIHFSGHGTKFSTEGLQTENLALVLYEPRNSYRSHLYGKVLRSCLKSMVDKGLVITLVLDCCFAGSVLRNVQAVGTSIRAIDHDPIVDVAFPPEPWSSLAVSSGSYREVELDHNWVVNPQGYTVLAACGVFDRAYELEIDNGIRHGGLSLFLLRALTDLRNRNVNITQSALYSHLCVRFKAIWSMQTPMLYGNRGIHFFGGLQTSSANPLVPLFWRKPKASDALVESNRRLYLGAGGVHGVCEGDTYDTYPLGHVDGTSVRVRVEVVHGLNSEVVAVKERTDIDQIQDGWNAKQVGSMASSKIATRIMEDAYNHIKDSSALDRLQFIELHIGNKDEKACQLNVQLNDSGHYCIYDGSMKELSDVPPIPADKSKAENDLAYILQRLASYKYLKQIGIERVEGDSIQSNTGLKTQAATIPDALYTVDAFSDGTQIHGGGPFQIKHGDRWYLRITNHGTKPLYLALFHFRSSWKIKDLTSGVGASSFEEIRPESEGGQEPIRLKMTVPQGKASCEDVIKIFLTSRPTSFPAMNLDTDLVTAQGTRTAVEAIHDGTGGLSAFLEALTALFRDGNGDEEGKNIEEDDIEKEGWTTRNFIIHTSLNGGLGT